MTKAPSSLGIKKFTYKFIQNSLAYHVYRPLRNYLIGKAKGGGGIIGNLAPKDTGALRKALEDGIKEKEWELRQFAVGYPFIIELGTQGIDYAKPVNRMPTRWLKHPAPWHKNVGSHSGLPLNDPEAKKNWFYMILTNGRNYATRLVRDWQNNILMPVFKPLQAAGVNPYNMAKQVFKIRFK